LDFVLDDLDLLRLRLLLFLHHFRLRLHLNHVLLAPITTLLTALLISTIPHIAPIRVALRLRLVSIEPANEIVAIGGPHVDKSGRLAVQGQASCVLDFLELGLLVFDAVGVGVGVAVGVCV
jgi:hypothetical protein